jgi:hypothetical protein
MKLWEVIRALEENPKRKMKCIDYQGHENIFYLHKEKTCCRITSIPDGYSSNVWLGHMDVDWDIIEPELKKVNFTDAFKAYIDKKTIQSCITKKSFYDCNTVPCCECKYSKNCNVETDFFDNIKKEEIDGEWIILD